MYVVRCTMLCLLDMMYAIWGNDESNCNEDMIFELYMHNICTSTEYLRVFMQGEGNMHKLNYNDDWPLVRKATAQHDQRSPHIQ